MSAETETSRSVTTTRGRDRTILQRRRRSPNRIVTTTEDACVSTTTRSSIQRHTVWRRRTMLLAVVVVELTLFLGAANAFQVPTAHRRVSSLHRSAVPVSTPNPAIIRVRDRIPSGTAGAATGTRPPRTRTTTSSLDAALIVPDAVEASSSLLVSMLPLVNSLLSSGGNVPIWQAFGLNVVLFTALQSKLRTMLTPEGFAHSLALGTLLWTTLGWKGWTTCVLYLFLGQLVTKVRFQEKESKGIAEKRGGRRGPENVWGSAATALICAACAAQIPDPGAGTFLGISYELYLLGFVASLATKLADTFASEIGKAYGKTTFLITTFERVEPGTEGAVSLEGTLAAVVGGFLLSLYGYGIGLITTPTALVISTVAAFFATNVESLLGATIQEKEGLEWLSNEVINFINTLVGATFAIVVGKAFMTIV